MANLSNLAETLRDFAVTLAKRHGNEIAGDLHVLASIHQWDAEEFEIRFPDQSARILEIIRQGRSDSLARPRLDETMEQRLSSVSKEADAWELARELMTKVGDTPPGSRATTSPVSDPGHQQSGVSDGRPAADPSSGLLITVDLCGRISAGLGRDQQEVTHDVAREAITVARIVAGGEAPEAVGAELARSLGVDTAGLEAADSLSGLVGQVVHAGFEGADRLGTELALALVDVGEWVAALDEELSREETDRIDEIRLALRAQLGDRIKAESDAFLRFESDFAHLVGMQSVKDELRKRVEFMLVARRKAARGHKVDVQRSHMAFLGNPGTGKTTVARLYGKLLHDVGLLPSQKLVETDRSGLVGEYIGHSEKKTVDVINSADGGVLFIDEAYALADNYGPDRKGFGAEATDVLVKQMEDRRDRLVVIVAGYSKPMQQFLSVNPGLRSRIPVMLEFPDYSDDELVTIAERIAERRSLTIDAAAKKKIREVLSRERNTEGFGNAREVENILDAAQRNVIARVSGLGNLATSEESSTLLPDDIPAATEPSAKRPIGFAPQSYL